MSSRSYSPRPGAARAAVVAALLAAPAIDAQVRDKAPEETWQLYVAVGGRPSMNAPDLRPGDSVHVVIASSFGRMGSYEAMPLSGRPPKVSWSLDHTGAGVQLTDDGWVFVRAGARPGLYVVRAQAEKETRTRELWVYDPKTAPLVGTWSEIAMLSCNGERDIQPADPLRELIFSANGDFSATWYPFETRKDYWGKYRYDLASASLEVTPANVGNYVPPDLKPRGTATIDSAGRLVLKGVWLGTPPSRNRVVPAGCGHVFKRW